MTDEAYAFRETEKERKRLARGAFSKKNGSRSKYVSLPSDKLTEKQRRELNGTLYSYDISKPMDWSTFVYMPLDIQREYLINLCKDHSGRLKDAAEMFGIAAGSLGNYINRHWSGWHPFQSMNGQKDINAEWLRWTSPDESKPPEVKNPQPEENVQEAPSSCVKHSVDDYTFCLDSGELRFNGNLRGILSKMLVVLDPSADYQLTISFVKSAEDKAS